jgi:hypothetical protein
MALRRRATTVPAPLSVQPSQKFDGSDGSWSTFVVSVGTPPQNFRVLPSTQITETWIISPDGCTSSDPSDCQSLRGEDVFNGQPPQGFLTASSSTWKQAGLYNLVAEDNFDNYTGNGLYGYDVLGINGGNSSGGLSLPNQLVASIATKSFFNGMFGLGAQPVSLSSAASSISGFMVNLFNNRQIPSLSYGYTAGAIYRKLHCYHRASFTERNIQY